MGALFVRSLRGRGGTRKQLGNHSKEFKERSSREDGAGPDRAQGGGDGASADGSDTERGGGGELAAAGTEGEYTAAAGSPPNKGPSGRRSPLGAGAGQGSTVREVRPPSDIPVSALSGVGVRRPHGFPGPRTHADFLPLPRQRPPPEPRPLPAAP